MNELTRIKIGRVLDFPASKRPSMEAIFKSCKPWWTARLVVSMATLLLADCSALRAQESRRDETHAAVGAALFENLSVPVFEISLDEAAVASLSKSNRTYVRGNIKEGPHILKDVGIRLKGRGTYQPLHRKPSFTIKFNEFSDQTYFGLTKLMLNNSAGDGSYLREYMANQLFREAGLPAPRVTHARIRLNGRNLGLYVVVEGITKAFLRQHFSQNNGNLYEGSFQDIDQPLDQDSGSDKSQADLKALLEATMVSDQGERWRRISQVLDVDRFISFVAMEHLLAQTDGYAIQANNYRIYFDPQSSRMVFFPHGLDSTFCDVHFTMPPAPSQFVTRAVLQTDQGRNLYHQSLATLFANVFSVAVLTNRGQQVALRLQKTADNPNEATQIRSNYSLLCKVIQQRASNIAVQIAAPRLEVVKFDARGISALSGWKSETQESVEIDQTVLDGRPCLHIRSVKEFGTASFRTRVLLEPGRYIFSGEVRATGIEPSKAPYLRPEGIFKPGKPPAGIVLFAVAKSKKQFLGSNSNWTEYDHEFEIEYGPQEIELVCELRASKGEVFFNADSLKVMRK